MAASLRHQTLKQSPSQHSFDSAILDGSLPDENLSVDSDVSDNLFVLMDSGIHYTTEHFFYYLALNMKHFLNPLGSSHLSIWQRAYEKCFQEDQSNLLMLA